MERGTGTTSEALGSISLDQYICEGVVYYMRVRSCDSELILGVFKVESQQIVFRFTRVSVEELNIRYLVLSNKHNVFCTMGTFGRQVGADKEDVPFVAQEDGST